MDNSLLASISEQDVRVLVTDFLHQRMLNNNYYKQGVTQLSQAESEQNEQKINEAKQLIAEMEHKFQLDNWLEDAIMRRLSWISLATHVSKGVHSASNGDNVNFNALPKASTPNYISSATLANLPYDATGSAAGLDIFNLFNQEIKPGITLLTLVANKHDAIKAVLSNDKAKSELYLTKLNAILVDDWTSPKASGWNKQLYWPINEKPYLANDPDHYQQIIPLHPSSLCHVVYQKVQTRYSDDNKQARDSRYKKTAEQKPYFNFYDLAVVHLGGSNPQNVSQLIGRQRGRNYLLPSLPPKYQPKLPFGIKKHQTTIFNTQLEYQFRFGLKPLFDMIEEERNTIKERDLRKDSLSIMLNILFSIAETIQSQMPAGWSRDYELNEAQKYWLDPKRAELSGESEFKEKREQFHEEWSNQIAAQFAVWLNSVLKARFKERVGEFTDIEIREWIREFKSARKTSLRKKQGVF